MNIGESQATRDHDGSRRLTVELRDERPEDIEAIDDVICAAFAGAVHRSGTEQAIVRVLRAAGALTVSVIAAVDGVIVGHAAASPVAVSDGSNGWFGLGPVAVMPGQQGRGVGSQLVTTVLDRLRQRGAAGCVVLGEPGYYGRFGFARTPALVLASVPPEYFLALPFGPTAASGQVTYHPAFLVG